MAVFGGYASKITGWFSSAYDKAKDTASDGYDTIIRYKDNFFSHLNSELSKVEDYFGQSADSVMDAINGAWNRATDIEKPLGIVEYGIAKAQSMANFAMDKVEKLTTPDLVKALTNWTIGFVLGIIQGFFNAIQYAFEYAFSRFGGALHAIAAGIYESIMQFGTWIIGFFNGIWSGAGNIANSFGPFAPVFAFLIVFVFVVVIFYVAGKSQKISLWITERAYELL